MQAERLAAVVLNTGLSVSDYRGLSVLEYQEIIRQLKRQRGNK